ncbi:MAG: zinc ribbon domain-containing protein [Acidobacteria bacterium]|nr:MAG: zinc ribbon domain-containing protein [Acidobacteriota bacterium]
MPLYEYECSSCGTRTEVLQRVGAPPIDDCSECGGKMKRLLSAPAVQFKGTGWYVTDYARKKDSGNGSKPKSDAGGGDSGKKESKSGAASGSESSKMSTKASPS